MSEKDDRDRRLAFTNTCLFETPGGIRYTQDSPILPNVWLAFALEPRSQQELILTVTADGGTGETAGHLRRMLKNLRKKRPMIGGDHAREKRKRARVCYIPGQIAVKLYFDEMMRVVLPLTPWWHETYDTLRRLQREYDEKNANPANWIPFPQPDYDGMREKDLVDALMLMRREIDSSMTDLDSIEQSQSRLQYIRDIPPDLCWLVRIAGLIADCFENGTALLDNPECLSSRINHDFIARDFDRIEDSDSRSERQERERLNLEDALRTRKEIVDAFVNTYENWCPAISEPNEQKGYPTQRMIWRVTKNRRVHLAVAKSSLTVKADAARRLFDISCRNITWAVLDSGIDGKHPAFRLTSKDHEDAVRSKLSRQTEDDEDDPKLSIDHLDSRVVKTLDFTRLRELLDYDIQSAQGDQEAKDRKHRIEQDIARRMSGTVPSREPPPDAVANAQKLLDALQERIRDGKDINWQDLEDAIVVDNPETPRNDHGTHVAGILAADWIDEDDEPDVDLPLKLRPRRMQGVCPDINLIDVRVFREDGLTDEFELLAALQFLRWMNARAGTMQVHGANLSLSLIHEVRRFACGQTPICDECNEASALGVVIVAAAGNRGFEMEDADTIRSTDSYKSVSITDPGNAENVITVGATHRKRPHEYGVSYFSSRGPTGDGRLKPDVVAPGEKIKGPTPNRRAEFKDGTSMAAPHVSGVAAMIMARHSELIGKPERIKSIICSTATDLGRERYFQGHGLVDALRALQSV